MVESLLDLLQVPVEPVDAALPQLTSSVHPHRCLLESLDSQAARPRLRRPSARDQAGLLEHLQVARDRRQAHGERLRELLDRRVALGEPLEDRQAGRVAQGGECLG
jgi:hypothetical protein